MGGLSQIDDNLRSQRQGRNRQRTILWMLAILVAAATCLVLMLPAISMTADDMDATQQDASTVAAQEDSLEVQSADDANEGASEEAGTDGDALEAEPAASVEEGGKSAASAESDAQADDAAAEQASGIETSAADDAAPQSESAASDTPVQYPTKGAGENSEATDDSTGNEGEGQSEAPASETAYPAQQFSDELKDKDGNVTLAVYVDAPEGALPEGATMKVKSVKPKTIRDAVDEALAREAAGEVDSIQAVDIAFLDVDGNEIEPAQAVAVTFTSPKIAQAADADNKPLVVHIDDEGQAALVDSLDDRALEQLDMQLEDDQLAIESDAFSVYALVYTVDFKYSVDGQVYDFSIPGGNKISLTDLADALGIIDGNNFTSISEFINEVTDVRFSNGGWWPSRPLRKMPPTPTSMRRSTSPRTRAMWMTQW